MTRDSRQIKWFFPNILYGQFLNIGSFHRKSCRRELQKFPPPPFPLLLGAHDEAAYGLSSNSSHLNTAHRPGTILSTPHTLTPLPLTDKKPSFNHLPKAVHGKTYKGEKEGKNCLCSSLLSGVLWVIRTPPPTPSKALLHRWNPGQGMRACASLHPSIRSAWG